MGTPEAAGSHVPGATRALAVLRLLAAAPGPLPASTIAARLGVPRSSAYHLLTAMAAEGFVVHVREDRRWGLGLAAFEVGSAYLRHDPLERLARPLLARLVDDLEDTAHLGVLHGRETLYLLKEQPRRRVVTLVTDVGVRLPAHLTASGKAILAHLPRAQVRAVFPDAGAFVDRTGRGARTLSQLNAELAAERRRGWSVEDELVTTGYASVAAPVFDHAAHPIAAVAVTFRREERPQQEWGTLAARVARTAAELTARVGGRPPARGTPRTGPGVGGLTARERWPAGLR